MFMIGTARAAAKHTTLIVPRGFNLAEASRVPAASRGMAGHPAAADALRQAKMVIE
jgi:hypothetical protein